MMMTSTETEILLSTANDGRTKDIRYRQRQLFSLHQWIVSHLDDIATAVRNDNKFLELEAQFMVSLTLQELKRHYEALDIKRELLNEYSVKNGCNNENGTSPVDLVYIVPDRFTLFYSVICALLACIAAGSCCFIELPSDLTCSVSVTRQCLDQALDKTAFMSTSSRPPGEVLNRCLIVDQTGSVLPQIGRRVLRSQPQLGTVAIVDRTANLELAAKQIFRSRMFCSGKGPYAPDCVLVNEFVEKDFVRLLREQSSNRGDEDVESNKQKNVLINTERFKVVKIHKRVDLHIRDSESTTNPILLMTTSSHDDAIDTLNNSDSHQNSFLALYVFASPHPAKYLTQFVRCHVSFVNHIPANLLVGPAAPIDHPLHPASRYTRTMMQTPSPKFVTPVPGEFDIQSITDTGSNAGQWQKLYKQSLQPLKPINQPGEGDRNFFIQGLVVGVVFLVLPIIMGVAVGGAYGVRKLRECWH